MQAAKEGQSGDLGSLQGRLDARDAQLHDATRQLNVLKFMLSNMNTEDTSGQVSGFRLHCCRTDAGQCDTSANAQHCCRSKSWKLRRPN